MKMLNLGCGTTFHPAWTNIDRYSSSQHVMVWDLRKGIPFQDGHFDVVYHSHLLEHLTPEQADQFTREVLRVLRPGGTIRVVVPDLEQITRLYLAKLEAALRNPEAARHDYQWMLIELFDQTTRSVPGGSMGAYLKQPAIPNLPFVRSRIGAEMDDFLGTTAAAKAAPPSFWKKLSNKGAAGLLQWARTRAAIAITRWVAGREAANSLREGLFRNSGEIHKWMYDRYSLAALLSRMGVGELRVCGATESRIPSFAEFGLDAANGQARKPDSLFMEGIKAGGGA